jgi:hypothetical protein
MQPPPVTPLILTRESAAHPRSLPEAARAGILVRIRRGVYVERVVWESLTLEGKYVCRVRALAGAAPDVVMSHHAAAVLHGLPLASGMPARIHVTVDSEPDGRSHPERAMHYATLRPDEVTAVNDIRATVPARTVIDVARVERFGVALAVADAAVRAGLASVEELWDAQWSARARRQSRRVERVIAAVDPRSESVGESLSRAAIIDLGFPAPELQVDLRGREGFLGRVDFWWPSHRVVGEFDGRGKYLDGRIRSAPSADLEILAEKKREDAIRRYVRGFARWDWSDLSNGDAMRHILQSAGVYPHQAAAARGRR